MTIRRRSILKATTAGALGLLASVSEAAATPQTANRKGAKRVGGQNSKGKGAKYVGGKKGKK